MTHPTPSVFRTAIVLGLVSAVGPFAIDMYLPAMPAIGQALATDVAQVQLTLTVYFVAIGIGQLVYGPLSDRFGRKPPLFAGLLLFTAASIGCALAQDVRLLIGLRFLQGLGGAAGMAIPRAIVRDRHTGPEAVRLMSLLMLVFSVSPILAPLVGSLLIERADWRAIFVAVALAGLAAIALVAVTLPETGRRMTSGQSLSGSAARSYRTLLRDRRYLGLILTGGCALLSFFVYLSASSFVLINHYGLTPTQYSLAFGLNAAAFIGAAQMNGRLARRFGLCALVRTGAIGNAAVITLLLLCYLGGIDRLGLLMGLQLVAGFFAALTIPNASVLALDGHAPIAGAASALMGSTHMGIGAVGMGLIGLVSDGRPLPMVAGMTAAVWLSLFCAMATLGLRERVVLPAG